MKILFSPAETKKSGGVMGQITKESFLFPELFAYREEVLNRYQNCIDTASDEQLSKLFGVKEAQKFAKYKTDLFSQPLMKAIERYDGVAFDYLGYGKLGSGAKNYIDQNVIIFSNLFGPIRAGDFGIPEYKLKQGEKIGSFAAEEFYKKHFSQQLDDMLADEVFLDLRAGFYTKFYKPTSEYVTLKFLKNGKVVSHWAKAYRGMVLRTMAQNNIGAIEEFMKMEIENLSIKEIIKKKAHTEIIYNITE
ncbi:MAG: YaaA family protein [Epsilonproteobacteria bacterium]|nr:YaaA family protein [Campylobacterota bacterium]